VGRRDGEKGKGTEGGRRKRPPPRLRGKESSLPPRAILVSLVLAMGRRSGGREEQRRWAGCSGEDGSILNSIVCTSKHELVIAILLNSFYQFYLHPNNKFGVMIHFQS
jgi:hypothetical protein